MQFFTISAVTGEGIEPLKYAIAKLVEEHRPAATADVAPLPPAKIKKLYPPPKPYAKGRAR